MIKKFNECNKKTINFKVGWVTSQKQNSLNLEAWSSVKV